MIVTLAGHVDHGKTSLVRALTGIDTDRLEQEKQRGLTIDLGFAYMDEGSIGFVDVPGHHKFIHNMVAGVAQNQYAMLVVAADDGPMPQTAEHLQILKLVGIEHGVVVMTKTDRVSSEQQSITKQRILELTAGTFLEKAELIRTSIDDDTSIGTLRQHLRKTATGYDLAADERPFRLAIDRAFNVRGAGLVVTGTARSGNIGVDDSLFHFPSLREVRVRSIRTQDQDSASASQGDRCALNLAGLDLQDVKRGDWLDAQPPGVFGELSLELDVLSDFPRKLRHWTPVHIYHATQHTTGRMALLQDGALNPGERAIVDLICDTPLCAVHGDHLVIRDQSLDITLGGGRVIHAEQSAISRRRAAERIARISLFAAGSPTTSLAGLLQHGPVDIAHFAKVRHLTNKQVSDITSGLDAQTIQNKLCSNSYIDAQAKLALNAIEQHQQAHPTAPGLRENQVGSVDAGIRQSVLNGLVQQNKLANEGGYYKLPQHKAALPEQLASTWKRLQKELDQAQAPSSGDLAKAWRIPQARLEVDLKELTKRGLVVQVAAHRFYLPRQLQNIAGEVKRLASTKPFSVRDFRDSTGIGRNVAIEVLEYFDSRGFTRRQGNERIVLKDIL